MNPRIDLHPSNFFTYQQVLQKIETDALDPVFELGEIFEQVIDPSSDFTSLQVRAQSYDNPETDEQLRQRMADHLIHRINFALGELRQHYAVFLGNDDGNLIRDGEIDSVALTFLYHILRKNQPSIHIFQKYYQASQELQHDEYQQPRWLDQLADKTP